MSSAIEVLKRLVKEEGLKMSSNEMIYFNKDEFNALKEALLTLEKQEKQLYIAYEQGQYDSLDYYGFFSTDEEAVKELTKAIGESFTSGNEYRFFKLDFSKKGIDTSLPVKEVLGVLK
jgi:DNA repair photolyase